MKHYVETKPYIDLTDSQKNQWDALVQAYDSAYGRYLEADALDDEERADADESMKRAAAKFEEIFGLDISIASY